MTNKNKNQKGFTLLEMIVSVGIFAMAILIALSSLLAITDSQKKAVALQNVLDNLRFSLEAMAKEIRTGSSYHCAPDISLVPQDCAGGASLTFLNAEGVTVTYFIQTNNSINQIMKKTGADAAWPVTAANVNMERMIFYVSGTGASDQRQPRATIVLEGLVSPTPRTQTRLNLETSVSQRKLDS